ncbi:hypothetical protein DPEC_G00184110 [Dallia pectoralis]|uniref:Uncharacterized protein n=1 Tax=Dallia pectoralis TaxID=75939 RepID=A0ACC2GBE2_DALPE|nr:hypothetical protein DPEC_G00184110 [Dallia pectoralis]
MFVEMSSEVFFRSRVVSIMETLTATALQDICQLMEETCAALREEMKHEHNLSGSRRVNTKLPENGSTWTEKPTSSTEKTGETTCVYTSTRGSFPLGARSFPAVEQILNEQEANVLWLNGDHSVGHQVPSSLVPEQEEPSQPLGQTTDLEMETWQAPLTIKQEETDDDMEFQGVDEWMPETYVASPIKPGQSDELKKSQCSGGSGKLKDFKRKHSPCRRSTGWAVAPKKRSHSNFTCEICGKIETQKRKLASHMITHTGMPHSCDICGEKFMLLHLLLRHKRSKHAVKTFSCSLCEKSFMNAASRDNHERSHSGKNYRCSDCGETFKERGDREMHKCIVYKGKQSFSCTDCNEKFDRQYHLKRHQLEKHPFVVNMALNPEVKSKILQDQQAEQESGGEKIKKPYCCSVCPMGFMYRKSCQNHELKHIRQDYCCLDCGKTFKERRDREAHKCIVYKGSQSFFRCSVCGKDFNKENRLKRHKLEKHPPLVEQTVNPEHDSKELQEQQGKQESGGEKNDKPYCCSVCPMVFVYQKSRDSHQRKHLGKDFCCSVCGKKFKEWQERNAHVCRVYKTVRPAQKHFRLNTGKSYSCSVCGKGFCYVKSLKKHELTHKKGNVPRVSDASMSLAVTNNQQLVDRLTAN